jgi:hypothetical protein
MDLAEAALYLTQDWSPSSKEAVTPSSGYEVPLGLPISASGKIQCWSVGFILARMVIMGGFFIIAARYMARPAYALAGLLAADVAMTLFNRAVVHLYQAGSAANRVGRMQPLGWPTNSDSPTLALVFFLPPTIESIL